MELKYLILFMSGLFLAGFLLACNKEDTNPSEAIMLPSMIIQTFSSSPMPESWTTTTTRTFEYDGQNRIKKIYSTFADDGVDRGITITVSLAYGENSITETTTRNDKEGYEVIRRFELQGSEIIIDKNSGDERMKIKLDNHLNPVKYCKHPDREGNYFVEFTYDSEGNATSTTFHLHPDTDRTQTYTFVNEPTNGIFRNVQTPSWYLTTQLDLDGIEYQNLISNCTEARLDNYTIYAYKNTYNAANYPVKILRHAVGIDGSGGLKHEIEYITIQK